MFRSPSALQELYSRLISHSMQCFGAREVMSFLGKKLVGQFRGEVVSDITDRGKRRWPGTRIKRRAKMNWIKMYDKVGSVLRVETVINEPDAFKVRKRVWREGRQSWAAGVFPRGRGRRDLAGRLSPIPKLSEEARVDPGAVTATSLSEHGTWDVVLLQHSQPRRRLCALSPQG